MEFNFLFENIGRNMEIIKGDIIEGTSVIYQLHNEKLIKGLEFADGRRRYFRTGEFGEFKCGLAVLDLGETICYINRSGAIILAGEFCYASDFSDDRAAVITNNKAVLFDTKGSIIKEFPEIPLIAPFHNGLAKIAQMKESGELLVSGYIDKSGNQVIPKIQEVWLQSAPEILDSEDDYYSDGLIRLYQEGCYGFIDKDINIRIPFIFDYASYFLHGLAAVKIEDEAGFIDKENIPVTPLEFQETRGFTKSGIAPVKQNDKWGAVNLNFDLVLPLEYEDLSVIEEDLLLFKTNGKYGIMNKNLDTIIKPKYDEILNYSEGICKFTTNNRLGVVDRAGNELIQSELYSLDENRNN